MASPRDIREMPPDDLVAHVATVRKNLFGLRFQNATGELENTAGLRSAKRELARTLTIARERGIDVSHAGSEN